MADAEELQDKTKDELLDLAREQDLAGRSSLNKDELVEALASDSGDGSVSEGGTEVRDPQDLLTSTGDGASDGESEGADERLQEVEDVAPVEADLAATELDFQGPLHLQAPEERIMTGAVNGEQAKEQEELLANRPEGFVGDVTEAGFDADGNLKTTKRTDVDRPTVWDELEAGEAFSVSESGYQTYDSRQDQVLGEKPKKSKSK